MRSSSATLRLAVYTSTERRGTLGREGALDDGTLVSHEKRLTVSLLNKYSESDASFLMTRAALSGLQLCEPPCR